MRMPAFGLATDAIDEYCRVRESIAMESLKRFVRAHREIYEPHHLLQPSRVNIDKQMIISEHWASQVCLAA